MAKKNNFPPLFRLLPNLTRRAHSIKHGVLRMKAALFAVGGMPIRKLGLHPAE